MLPQIAVTAMSPQESPWEATNLRNAMGVVHLKNVKHRGVPSKYGISSRFVRSALQASQDLCAKDNLPKLIEDKDHDKIARWAKNYTQAPICYSEHPQRELQEVSFLKATSRVKYRHR